MAADADLLTPSELRERAQGVWDNAEISETPGIMTSARAMLAALTNGDLDALEAAVGDMDAACSNVDTL
jgi:hypothetical protein